MRRLKTRARADSAVNEPRRARRHWDRIVYLALLAGFAWAMLDYMLGHRVLLRAHGLVVLEREVVEAVSLVRVSRVHVAPGEAVEAGEVLVEAPSFQVLDRLAELSMRDAELTERRAALLSRAALAERLRPIYATRLGDMEARRGDLEGARRGATRARLDTAERDLHDARVDLARVEAQLDTLFAEADAVGEAREHARGALADLTASYGGGLWRSSVSGIVGEVVPARGEVFRPGEPLLAVLHGRAYVLAYLPEEYLFGVSAGDRVRVSNGRDAHGGRVSEILPVSASIPDEFRNAFKIDETRQLARIELDPGQDFPAFSSVTISRERGWLAAAAAALGAGP